MCFGDVATTTMVRATAPHTGNIEFSRRVAISLIHQFEWMKKFYEFLETRRRELRKFSSSFFSSAFIINISKVLFGVLACCHWSSMDDCDEKYPKSWMSCNSLKMFPLGRISIVAEIVSLRISLKQIFYFSTSNTPPMILSSFSTRANIY